MLAVKRKRFSLKSKANAIAWPGGLGALACRLIHTLIDARFSN
jgi:hypothetical protein